MKKSIRIVLTGFIIVTFVAQVALFLILSDMNRSSEEGMSIRGADIVIFIADGVAEEDLTTVSTYLQNWKGRVSIAGANNESTSLNGSIFLADFLIEEIYNVSFFDAVFIPGGVHYQTLISHPMVIELLQTASTNGRVIAGLNEGTLVLAEAGLINGKKFTTTHSLVQNVTDSGGTYIEGTNVITDDNIITAHSSNYTELSYAIGNAMGYSFFIDVDIDFNNEDDGWNYSIIIRPKDQFIVDTIRINLSKIVNSNQKLLVGTYDLVKGDDGKYSYVLGILENGEYVIDAYFTSIYGNLEMRMAIIEFSVGGN
ncbi:MAG: DJ-1/PfpI family protein [Candidatus Hodarchaeales archaeon]|jgi:putative intracellular protease/amidase